MSQIFAPMCHPAASPDVICKNLQFGKGKSKKKKPHPSDNYADTSGPAWFGLDLQHFFFVIEAHRSSWFPLRLRLHQRQRHRRCHKEHIHRARRAAPLLNRRKNETKQNRIRYTKTKPRRLNARGRTRTFGRPEDYWMGWEKNAKPVFSLFIFFKPGYWTCSWAEEGDELRGRRWQQTRFIHL